MQSSVRIGNITKQIVSGIKGSYSPEEMVGKKVFTTQNGCPVPEQPSNHKSQFSASGGNIFLFILTDIFVLIIVFKRNGKLSVL